MKKQKEQTSNHKNENIFRLLTIHKEIERMYLNGEISKRKRSIYLRNLNELWNKHWNKFYPVSREFADTFNLLYEGLI